MRCGIVGLVLAGSAFAGVCRADDKLDPLAGWRKGVKVAAGEGSKGPGGPTMDLPPGKYSFSYKIGSKPPKTDQVEIKAGETWGLMIGPGGVLVVQVN